MALVDSYTMLCHSTKRHLTKSEHFRNGPKGLERKIIICINTMHSLWWRLYLKTIFRTKDAWCIWALVGHCIQKLMVLFPYFTVSPKNATLNFGLWHHEFLCRAVSLNWKTLNPLYMVGNLKQKNRVCELHVLRIHGVKKPSWKINIQTEYCTRNI